MARALAWHARGHRFDSDILHKPRPRTRGRGFLPFETKHEKNETNGSNKVNKKTAPEPLKTAKLTISNVRSFVSYYIYSNDNGKLKRQIVHCPAAYKTDVEITKWGAAKVKEINEQIRGGAAFMSAKKSKKIVDENACSLIEQLQKSIDERRYQLRKKSIQTYTSEVRGLAAYLSEKKSIGIAAESFTPDFAKKYRIHLLEKGRKPNGVNRSFARLRVIFNLLVDCGTLKKSPLTGLKSLQETEHFSNVAITKDDQHIILTHFDVTDVDMYFFLHFMYHSFIRPKELIGLKIKHISTDRITIIGEISKNRKTQTVPINPKLRQIIDEMELHNYGKECYIFGKRLRICGVCCAANYAYNLHRAAILSLGLDKNYTLYSWKHAGAIAALQVLKNAKKVSILLRHSSIAITDTYFKSLGLTIFDDVSDVSW